MVAELTDGRIADAAGGRTGTADLVIADCAIAVVGRYPYRMLRDHTIAISDGSIIAIEPSESAVARAWVAGARTVVDATGQVAVPGFINTHIHTAFTRMRGREPEASLARWLPHVFAESETLDPAAVREASAAGFAELASAGFTTVLDHHYAQADRRNYHAVLAEAARSGLRVVVAPTFPDCGHGAVDDEAAVAELAELAAAVPAVHGGRDPLVRVGIALAAPAWRESLERCRLLAQASRAADLPVTYHFAETSDWLGLLDELGVRRLTEPLESVGLLGPHVVLAHGVWLRDADVAALARTGTSVSYNPIANAYLGDGVLPLRALLDAGVNVALGTDTVQCCGRPDPFEAMRFGALLQKAVAADGTAVTAPDILRVMWEGGARAMGDDRLGRIDAGAVADIVLLDRAGPGAGDRGRFVDDRVEWSLVYATERSDVRTVIVDGRVVVGPPLGERVG